MRHKYLFGLLIAVAGVCLYLFQTIYSEVKEKTIAELNSRQLIHAGQAGRGIEEYFSDLIMFLTKVSGSGHIITASGYDLAHVMAGDHPEWPRHS